ncbi:hypothetical protein [Brevundimonas sp. TSRC1-1]|uniref:hypothetical protein n=1 Tax=Brevundimonas sp. TSRC1-1 TaxID=2804562 RepID=UPI003CF4BDCB
MSDDTAPKNGPNLTDIDRKLSELIRLLNEVRHETWRSSALAVSKQLWDAFGADGRYSDPKTLARYNRRMYSQHGEDGIISEIFSRIGEGNKRFFEIGVGDGTQNTTRFLLERGWSGVWVEGSPELAESAKEFMKQYIDSGDLKIVQAFITAENVSQIVDEVDENGKLDYLSIDIDYNTPHVWRALRRSSRVACLEYNCTMPPNIAMTVPYDPNGVWDGTAWYGGSLKAFENIGLEKGMALVGSDLVGVNAYFVNFEEAKGKFREPFDAATHYEPPRYYEYGHQHPPPTTPRRWVTE